MLERLSRPVAVLTAAAILVAAPGQPLWAAVARLTSAAVEPISGAATPPDLPAAASSLPAMAEPAAIVPGLSAAAAPAGPQAAAATPSAAPASAAAQARAAFDGVRLLPVSELGVDAESLGRDLAPSFAALPSDPYRPAAPGSRSRAAAVIDIDPAADGGLGRFHAAAGAAFQTLDGQASYPGIEPSVLSHPGLLALVRAVASTIPPEERRHGLRVGIHQMRVAAGEVTPEGLHQDDHARYIATWVVDRAGEGAASVVTADAAGNKVLAHETLGRDDVLLIDNAKVWHGVTPLEGAGARRDVIVLAISPREADSALSTEKRAGLYAAARAELSRPRPDAPRLRALYAQADAGARGFMLKAFRRWSRFFALPGVPAADWSFLKSAAAPWAGTIYVHKMESFLERMRREAPASTGRAPAEQAREIHRADHAFARAFVQAAGAADVDAELAAETISDEAVYRTLIEPILTERSFASVDPDSFIPELAKRLKAAGPYLYDDSMTEERIRAILERNEDVRKRWTELVALVAPYARVAAAEPAKEGANAVAPAVGAAGRTIARALIWALPLLGGLLGLAHSGDAHGAMLAMALAPGAAGAGLFGRKDDGRSGSSKLPDFLDDLTQAAARGEVEEVYLRDREEAALARILNQTRHNAALLLGEAGVGKTAVVEALALRMARRQTGTELDGMRLLSLDPGKFLAAAGADPRAFGAAMDQLIAAVSDGKTILFIDEAHQLARDPQAPAVGPAFFDALRPALARGRVKLVLTTTWDDHRRFFAADASLMSRAKILEIEPIPEKAAIETLYRLRRQFERGAEITYEAARAAVTLTVRAYRFQSLMRMAIKALDEASTAVRVRRGQARMRLFALRRDLEHYLEALREARAAGQDDRARDVASLAADAADRVAQTQQELERSEDLKARADDVAAALVEAGAPLHQIDAGTKEGLERIRGFLNERLIGREKLVERTVEAIARRYANPNVRKPVLSVLLDGTTGGGKTEYARLLAKVLLGIDDFEKAVYKIDGGEYIDKHSKSRIVGAPPSYVGFGQTETLADHVREHPKTIILVDEVDKMHPDILDLFLGITEDGVLKDSRGRPVDFSNVIVVFTSNFGVPADYPQRSHEEIEAAIRAAMKRPYQPEKELHEVRPFNPFRPEFLNRLDLIEVLPWLTRDEAARIAALRLAQTRERWWSDHRVEVAYDDEPALIEALLEKGYSVERGARGLNAALAELVETPLSKALLDQRLHVGSRAKLRRGGEIAVEHGSRAGSLERIDALARTDAGRALSEKLEALLAGLQPGQPLPAATLDALLGGADDRPAPALPWPLEKPAASHKLQQHQPGKKDAALDAALEALSKTAPAARDAAKALALAGKAVDLEDALTRLPGQADASFRQLELQAKAQGAAPAALKEAIAKADAELPLTMSWSVEAGRLRLLVQGAAADLPKNRAVLREFFEAQAQSADQALVSAARADAEAAGGGMGWGASDGKLALYLEWPLAAAAAKPVAAAVEEPAPAPVPAPAPAAAPAKAPAPAAPNAAATPLLAALAGSDKAARAAAVAAAGGLALKDPAAAPALAQALAALVYRAGDAEELAFVARWLAVLGENTSQPSVLWPAAAGVLALPTDKKQERDAALDKLGRSPALASDPAAAAYLRSLKGTMPPALAQAYERASGRSASALAPDEAQQQAAADLEQVEKELAAKRKALADAAARASNLSLGEEAVNTAINELHAGMAEPSLLSAELEKALRAPFINAIAHIEAANAKFLTQDPGTWISLTRGDFLLWGRRPNRRAQEYVSLYLDLASRRPDLIPAESWARWRKTLHSPDNHRSRVRRSLLWAQNRMVDMLLLTKGRGLPITDAAAEHRALTENGGFLKAVINRWMIDPFPFWALFFLLAPVSFAAALGAWYTDLDSWFWWKVLGDAANAQDWYHRYYEFPVFLGTWIAAQAFLYLAGAARGAAYVFSKRRIAARLASAIVSSYSREDLDRLIAAITEVRPNGRRRVRREYRPLALRVWPRSAAFRQAMRGPAAPPR